uniref:uncharacterized protein LOC122776789 n=1 Tax=Solea senegalensis TaxID=28829 RepID=UPI001CD86ACB|nr:uncharacterized protein LOC122776789 [Solea senegalensis]
MRPIVNPFLGMPYPTEQQQREINQGKCCKTLLAVFFIGIITTGVSVQWPGHQKNDSLRQMDFKSQHITSTTIHTTDSLTFTSQTDIIHTLTPILPPRNEERLKTSREYKDTEGKGGVGVSPMQEKVTVTEELVRKKRQLFEHTDWKPWNFNANELLDNSNQKNSWYSFIGWMKNKVYGSNTTVLIVQSPPANWHSLFQLEVRHCPCLDPVISLVQYYADCPHMDTTSRKSCKASHHAWYTARKKVYSHTTYQANMYLSCVDWFCENMVPQSFPSNSTYAEPTEIPNKSTNLSHSVCLCSNGTGQFMGISHCSNPVISLNTNRVKFGPIKITFRNKETVLVNKYLHAPAHKGIPPIGNFYWLCGNEAFLFLPPKWSGCCYFVNLTIANLEILPITLNQNSNPMHVHKREMAQFSTLSSYHWRISLGEKWGIGLLPWYGVTFLADHIDNITYSMSGFANETIKGFQYLAANDKSHRLTLLKHEMALDYILAKTGGLCLTLNLTGDSCVTIIPDNSDNITSVITALEKIRDSFGPSESAGFSFNRWLNEQCCKID